MGSGARSERQGAPGQGWARLRWEVFSLHCICPVLGPWSQRQTRWPPAEVQAPDLCPILEGKSLPLPGTSAKPEMPQLLPASPLH